MKVPFSPPYIDEDVIAEVQYTLQSGWITTGPKVRELEKSFEKYCDVSHALGVNSATSGLMLALHWYGITAGDEVLIPAYTYCATALAVIHVGAKPVMIDSGRDFNIDTSAIEKHISSKTKAIIAVDIAGLPCHYDEIFSIVKHENIRQRFVAANLQQQLLGRILIIDDAAHAFGATYHTIKNWRSSRHYRFLSSRSEKYNERRRRNDLFKPAFAF